MPVKEAHTVKPLLPPALVPTIVQRTIWTRRLQPLDMWKKGLYQKSWRWFNAKKTHMHLNTTYRIRNQSIQTHA